MKKSGFTLIELMMVSVVLAVLTAIAIPNFSKMQTRAMEAEVKSVAHSVQIAIEDYKTSLWQEGIKPTQISQFRTYLPTNVVSKVNPFTYGRLYGEGEIVLLSPNADGRVGYTPNGTLPYFIEAQGKSNPSQNFILTLVEGQ